MTTVGFQYREHQKVYDNIFKRFGAEVMYDAKTDCLAVVGQKDCVTAAANELERHLEDWTRNAYGRSVWGSTSLALGWDATMPLPGVEDQPWKKPHEDDAASAVNGRREHGDGWRTRGARRDDYVGASKEIRLWQGLTKEQIQTAMRRVEKEQRVKCSFAAGRSNCVIIRATEPNSKVYDAWRNLNGWSYSTQMKATGERDRKKKKWLYKDEDQRSDVDGVEAPIPVVTGDDHYFDRRMLAILTRDPTWPDFINAGIKSAKEADPKRDINIHFSNDYVRTHELGYDATDTDADDDDPPAGKIPPAPEERCIPPVYLAPFLRAIDRLGGTVHRIDIHCLHPLTLAAYHLGFPDIPPALDVARRHGLVDVCGNSSVSLTIKGRSFLNIPSGGATDTMCTRPSRLTARQRARLRAVCFAEPRDRVAVRDLAAVMTPIKRTPKFECARSVADAAVTRAELISAVKVGVVQLVNRGEMEVVRFCPEVEQLLIERDDDGDWETQLEEEAMKAAEARKEGEERKVVVEHGDVLENEERSEGAGRRGLTSRTSTVAADSKRASEVCSRRDRGSIASGTAIGVGYDSAGGPPSVIARSETSVVIAEGTLAAVSFDGPETSESTGRSLEMVPVTGSSDGKISKMVPFHLAEMRAITAAGPTFFEFLHYLRSSCRVDINASGELAFAFRLS
ncbi:hypothetical protein HK101_010767 [Irineochytrium annulatum]|nr:hypothetical protein HK101_010767 [Irineochytrium annulatum]